MTSRHSTPMIAGALEPAQPRGAGGRRRSARHSISSPVSSTNTSSRFAGRRSPSGSAPLRPRRRRIATDGAGPARRAARRRAPRPRPRRGAPAARRPRAPRARRARAPARCGGPVATALAVGHDRHRVGEPLGLLDVVRRHQDRRALASAARRSAPTAPGGPAGRARRSARRAAPAAAGARARGRSAAAGACRPTACRRACRARSPRFAISSARSTAAWRSPARRRGRGARTRRGSARPSARRRGCRAAARRRTRRAPAWSRSGSS